MYMMSRSSRYGCFGENTELLPEHTAEEKEKKMIQENNTEVREAYLAIYPFGRALSRSVARFRTQDAQQ